MCSCLIPRWNKNYQAERLYTDTVESDTLFKCHSEEVLLQQLSFYWWTTGYRGVTKIFRYTRKILPVASLLKSAFLVSIRVSICYVIKQTSSKLIKEDHTIARPVCLLKCARVGALSGKNMVEATHVIDEKGSAFQR